MNDFGSRVRAALNERGVSLRGAAKATNYDAGYLSRVLSGQQRPSTQVVDALDRLVGANGELSTLAAALNEEDRARIARNMGAPSRVDVGTVDALADVLKAQRRLEDTIGPAAMIPATTGQLSSVATLARESRGAHRSALLAVAAEWHQYVGWLHAATRDDSQALRLLGKGEELSDEAGEGTVAAVAVSFRGYVARQRGNFRGVVRASHAASHAPGSHQAQRVFDTMQAAIGHAGLGETDTARRLLDKAAESTDASVDPPAIVYWYSPEFFLLNIGLARLSLDDYEDAAGLLAEGLDGIPPEQQRAEWLDEYRDALDTARAT